jgi:uncharacterized protein YdaU (DUF1376 family)
LSAPPYMPLYVGDYLADTTHLDGIESGAYLHLLMAMWRAGGKLPATDDKLAKLTKLTPKQWALVKPAVMEFFTRRGASISHGRLSKELAKYHDKSVRLSEAGKRGQFQKHKKNNAKGVSQASATLKQPEPEPEGREERLLHSLSPTFRTDDAARHGGATTTALRVVEKEPLEVRQAAVASIGRGLPKIVHTPPSETASQMAERLRKAMA